MSERTPPTTAEFVLRVAERFGIPVVLLGFLLWMARDTAIGIHGSVVVPMVKAHTEFLDATQSALTEIGQAQAQQAATLEGLAESSREIKSILTSGRNTSTRPE